MSHPADQDDTPYTGDVAGTQLPDRSPETLRRFRDSFYAPTRPVEERQPEDERDSDSR